MVIQKQGETATPSTAGETPDGEPKPVNELKTYTINEILDKAVPSDLKKCKEISSDSAKYVAKGSMSLCTKAMMLPFVGTLWFVKQIINLEIYMAKSILLFFCPDLQEQIQNSKTVMTNAVHEAFSPLVDSLKTFCIR